MMFYRSILFTIGVLSLQEQNAFGFTVTTVLTTTKLKPSHFTPLNSISSEVTDEMKVAMKAKDKKTLGVIRLIRSAFSNAQIDLKTDELSDDQAQTVLRKMAKMRQESIEMYVNGGAEDRADAERTELEVIERWLPKLANEEQTRAWAQEAISKVGADNMGKVMGFLMKDHKAELDGKLTQKVVKEEIAKAKE